MWSAVLRRRSGCEACASDDHARTVPLLRAQSLREQSRRGAHRTPDLSRGGAGATGHYAGSQFNGGAQRQGYLPKRTRRSFGIRRVPGIRATSSMRLMHAVGPAPGVRNCARSAQGRPERSCRCGSRSRLRPSITVRAEPRDERELKVIAMDRFPRRERGVRRVAAGSRSVTSKPTLGMIITPAGARSASSRADPSTTWVSPVMSVVAHRCRRHAFRHGTTECDRARHVRDNAHAGETEIDPVRCRPVERRLPGQKASEPRRFPSGSRGPDAGEIEGMRDDVARRRRSRLLRPSGIGSDMGAV